MNYNLLKNKIIGYLSFGNDDNEEIRTNKSSVELIRDFDFSISKKGKDEEELGLLIDGIVKNSVNTDHPFFMNQMYGKQNPIAIYGDILTTLLNTSMYTYEVAPMMTLLEKECITKLCSYIWENNKGDGVFTPGGSFSNMMGIMLARNYKLKDVKASGLYDAPRFSIFISDQAHYSFLKGSIFMGFGNDSIVKVATNQKGEINIDALLKAIELEKQEGKTPLMLVGVAGTTFSGVYDDLEALSEIAVNNDMWYHVDAVYGGSLMFSETEKHKFKGIEKADSVSWNLHKMMGIPLICSTFLTKELGLLNEAFSVNADYLFHDNDDLDLGQKSLQCGRRVDSLKLWLAWKYEGEEGFEDRVNNLMNVAVTFAKKIEAHPSFELLCQPESPIVIFRLLAINFKGFDLNLLNKLVRNQLFKEGKILFNYSEYKGQIYMRCVISDPDFENDQITLLLNKIEETAYNLVNSKEFINSINE